MSPKPWNIFFFYLLIISVRFWHHVHLWSSDGRSLTVSACMASHSWGDWILWAKSLVASWGLIDKTNLDSFLTTKKGEKNKQYSNTIAQTNPAALLENLISDVRGELESGALLSYKHLTHRVHCWAGHKSSWCCPSRFLYSEGWWLCLQKHTPQRFVLHVLCTHIAFSPQGKTVTWKVEL